MRKITKKETVQEEVVVHGTMVEPQRTQRTLRVRKSEFVEHSIFALRPTSSFFPGLQFFVSFVLFVVPFPPFHKQLRKHTAWTITLCTLLFAVFLCPMASADVTVIEKESDDGTLAVFKMTVTPAAEPVPALKHRFQLRPHQTKPGNAATHYMRAYAENNLGRTWSHVRKKHGEAVDHWYGSSEFPIRDLPLDEVRQAASAFDGIVANFIRPASQCRDCDWGLELMDLRGTEVISVWLSEFQESRSMSRMLSLRTRLAIAEGRYDDAIDHMRMNFQLGRNVGKEPMLVCSLIGLAEVGINHWAIIDLIGAKDSPNLYWALSELPRPLVDMRESTRLEMTNGLRLFPVLLDVETAEHSPREWARLIAEGAKDFQSIGHGLINRQLSLDQQDTLRSIAITSMSMLYYPHAKDRLLQSGMPAEKVEQMPVGQALLIDAAREYQRTADEFEKWLYVPYPIAKERMRRVEKEQFGSGTPMQGGYGKLFADLLLPGLRSVRTAQVRSELRMASLRVVEAIRMHAAETGKLPATLDEIEVVPVPLNPVTTKPFAYRLDEKMAVLDLPFSDGIPGVAWRFEIELEE